MNTGLVVVNQMIDYINRAEELLDMCLYEYSEKVYKTKRDTFAGIGGFAGV